MNLLIEVDEKKYEDIKRIANAQLELADKTEAQIIANGTPISTELEEINERLINEYISKVSCCDECFASVYCIVNGLRESRVPQDYCVNNIKRYFDDMAKPMKGGVE